MTSPWHLPDCPLLRLGLCLRSHYGTNVAPGSTHRQTPAFTALPSAPRTALVLGAGGRAGVAHHAGALSALTEHGVIDLDALDLVVGTSAGAIVGAQLRSGLDAADLWEISVDDTPGAEQRRGDDLFEPAWSTIAELMRRGVGSSLLLGRSLARRSHPSIPGVVHWVFPSGLMRVARHIDLDAHLPSEWPDQPLWLATVDVRSGRRVMLGRDRLPRPDLQRAVMASAAVPGVYEPVPVSGHTLVDGGVHSTTNADAVLELHAENPFDRVVIVAPMGLRSPAPMDPLLLTLRTWVHRSLRREVAQLEAAGIQVEVFEPGAAIARAHGLNTLRAGVAETAAQLAYTDTAGLLDRRAAQSEARDAKAPARQRATGDAADTAAA